MNIRWQASLIVTAAILVLARPAFPCSVGRFASGIQIPATPPPGNARTSGVPDTKVHFSVEETVKGTYPSKEIVLAGYLSDTDDWNDQRAPYTFVRREGRHGSCFANTYKTGGQFLLLLKRSGTEYTVNWYALGPVNEQLHSTSDPWLLWVKEQAAK